MTADDRYSHPTREVESRAEVRAYKDRLRFGDLHIPVTVRCDHCGDVKPQAEAYVSWEQPGATRLEGICSERCAADLENQQREQVKVDKILANMDPDTRARYWFMSAP